MSKNVLYKQAVSNLINASKFFDEAGLAQESAKVLKLASDMLGRIKIAQHFQYPGTKEIVDMVKGLSAADLSSPANLGKMQNAASTLEASKDYKSVQNSSSFLLKSVSSLKPGQKQSALKQRLSSFVKSLGNYPKDLQAELGAMFSGQIMLPVTGKLDDATWKALNLFYHTYKVDPLPENIHAKYKLYYAATSGYTDTSQAAKEQEALESDPNMVALQTELGNARRSLTDPVVDMDPEKIQKQRQDYEKRHLPIPQQSSLYGYPEQ